ncbi:MAG: alpha-amylase family glycosyl hydrolase [Paraglaciecola polaris]|uniref:alpha-amylase family glycosyl hydrolase n=1 Tax=Paraglaciecola polaris TaxID=222814 RepID=UPI003002EE41
MTNKHEPLGLFKTEFGYRVRLWAPNATNVAICGEFDGWSNEGVNLSKDNDGVWYGCAPELKNNQQYQFSITTESGDILKRNDPRGRLLTNSAGTSVVYDDDYIWPKSEFMLANVEALVIYELHIGTFNCTYNTANKPGTFRSAIEKLDYLSELGVNCIEVMPVNEFAGDFSWGYNPAYPFAVEEAYGGPNGLKDLVREAHARNIGVILDVVYNHFGPSDLHLWQFDGWSENEKGGIYFYNDWRSDTPWGDTRPDYGRPQVRQYIFDNAMMWLEEFKLDGLRMDMIPYMRSVSGTEDPKDCIKEAYGLLRWINAEIKNRYPHKLVVAEDLHGNDFVTDHHEHNGLGYTAQWDADFVHPIRNVLTQPNDDDRDLNLVSKALTRCYSSNAFSRVIYVESHDEVANGSARLAEEIAPGNVDKDYFARQRSVIGVVLTLTAPGIPMLFQGQELLEDLWFDDKDPIDWSRLDKFPQLNQAYKTLISLRKNSISLQGENVSILHMDHANKVLAYERKNIREDDDDKAPGTSPSVLVIINFKNQRFDNYLIPDFDNQQWKCIFNWHNGYIEPNEFAFTQTGDNKCGKINIGEYQILIFERLM